MTTPSERDHDLYHLLDNFGAHMSMLLGDDFDSTPPGRLLMEFHACAITILGMEETWLRFITMDEEIDYEKIKPQIEKMHRVYAYYEEHFCFPCFQDLETEHGHNGHSQGEIKL